MTPGRYVGLPDEEVDFNFLERFAARKSEFEEQLVDAFIVISDGFEAKAGSISAGFTGFMAWKTSDGKTEASPLIGHPSSCYAKIQFKPRIGTI